MSCATAERLYCFGINNQASVMVTPAPAFRRAFTTSTSWTPGGGINSADTLCNSEASSTGLPGTYKALLATTNMTAASRFNTAGPPWARVDGILLAPTAAELFSATYWDAPVAMFANGTPTGSGSSGVWGGAASLNALGTAATTCNNWTTTMGTVDDGVNYMTRVEAVIALQVGASNCNASFNKLICLQE